MDKILNIKAANVSDIVTNMSAILKTDFEENHNEYCLRIPEKIGSGYIKATVFDHGIGVVEIDFLLKEEMTFVLEHGVVHPLKILFNRESPFVHKFTEDDSSSTIKRFESCIIASSPNNNHLFKIPGNVPVSISSLEINRKLFESRIESFLPNMNEDLVDLFRDVNGINNFFYKGNYTLEISKLLEEFSLCEMEDFMKSVFLESRAYEIFVSQLQQYLDDLNEPEKRKILRQSTIKSIEEATVIITKELDRVDNVNALAKRVGLNQNTLQNGFNKLYNSSVKEYIRNQRIEKAKELLKTSDLNITEITYKIGINSRSYFSKIFKEKYGISPKAYLNKSRSLHKN